MIKFTIQYINFLLHKNIKNDNKKNKTNRSNCSISLPSAYLESCEGGESITPRPKTTQSIDSF